MIQVAFGKRIKELRKQTGLSQEKFALKIGMDRTYYASIESGKRNVSLKNIIIRKQKIASRMDKIIKILSDIHRSSFAFYIR